MTPGPYPSSDDGPDRRADVLSDQQFEDWIQRIARAENVPQDQIRRQLISAFWTFEELAGKIKNSPFDQDALLNREDSSEPRSTKPEASPNRSDEREREEAERPQAPETEQQPERGRPSWDTLLDIIEALDEFGQSQAEPAEANDGSSTGLDQGDVVRSERGTAHSSDVDKVGQRTEERLCKIRNRISDLEEAVEETIQPPHLEALGLAFGERVSRLNSSFDTLESTVDEEVGRLDGALSEHADAFETVEQHLTAQADRLEEHGTTLSSHGNAIEGIKDQLASHEDRLDTVGSAIDRQRSALDTVSSKLSTHESELQSAETVLRHLFDELDRVDDRIDRVIDVLGGLKPVVEAHHEREHVEAIRQEAARLGRWRAECESCGERIEIRGLFRPYCPHCDVPISDVQVESGWFRTTTKLTTGRRVDEELEWGSRLWSDDSTRDLSAEPAASANFRFVGDS